MIRNELIPPLNVLADYAKRINQPFDTIEQKKKVIAHYKNFGSQLN